MYLEELENVALEYTQGQILKPEYFQSHTDIAKSLPAISL